MLLEHSGGGPSPGKVQDLVANLRKGGSRIDGEAKVLIELARRSIEQKALSSTGREASQQR